MPSLEGAWTGEYSGGLPPLETWAANPQFAIFPTVANASYTIEIVRHGGQQVRSGLWVMKADSMDGRKSEFTGSVQKTNVSTNERRTLTLELPPRKGGLPYIAMCATQEPGKLASFTLTVTSVEDAGVRVEALQAAPAAKAKPSAAARANDEVPANEFAKESTSAAPARPKPLGDFTGNAAPPPLTKKGTTFAFSTDAPSNVPVLETLGQGLSKKLKDEAAALVQRATAAAQGSGGLFEDGDFPAADASLGGLGGVVSWRRLGEIEPEGTGGLLERAEGVGVAMGSLDDEWLVGALNVVAGNVDVVERTFVDMSHADQGFYVVRLWAEDPMSDDDWAVVLVDDRLPCGGDGQPAFCRGSKPGALWASLVEKAVAKRYGSYADLKGDGGGEATIRGLELITGGKARELAFPPGGRPDEAGEVALWGSIKEALEMNEVLAVRCDAGTPQAARAADAGLVVGRTYCLIVANDFSQNGEKLMKLRAFAGDPEWNGDWSDNSPKWTNRMRQMLAYSKDSDDGTFWMAFDDFAKHFSSAYANKVADDQWNKFSVKSRWMDVTAGGGPAYVSWRDNYQWLLTLPRETQLTFELSLPDPRLSSAALMALPPIGLLVVQGNGGANARRRKLQLKDLESEIVYHAEPRATRRMQLPVRLPASPAGSPYVVVPYCMSPGAESPYKLSILVDDLDDDGKPDIQLDACLPNPPNPDDWSTVRKGGSWQKCAAAPNMAGFARNDKLSFSLEQPPGGASEGRVFVCVETIGINRDGRLTAGMQQAPDVPAIGVALIPSANGALTDQPPANVLLAGPTNRDGVWLEAVLPAGGKPHLVIPFLGSGQNPPAHLQYTVTVYSELPLAAAAAASDDAAPQSASEWECETCEPGHGFPCPYRAICEKMEKMEALMDERIAFLQALETGAAYEVSDFTGR